LHYEKESSETKLNELLKCKIFKEGYEDVACKPDIWRSDSNKTIAKFME
jgi:hypothetical protein